MTTSTVAAHANRTGGRRWRHLPRGRTLHLLDVENLLGTPVASAAEVALAFDAYRSTLRVRDGDHVVIACNHALVLEAGLAWPQARVVPGSGPDGADLALIGEAEPDYTSRHYDRVVIGSGDGIFTGLVSELRRRGTAVCVVARDGSLAASLRAISGLAVTLAA